MTPMRGWRHVRPQLARSIGRAAVWAVLGGGIITAVVALRTAPEFQLVPRQIATWFLLFFGLSYVPALAMELGARYLEAELGFDEKRSPER